MILRFSLPRHAASALATVLLCGCAAAGTGNGENPVRHAAAGATTVADGTGTQTASVYGNYLAGHFANRQQDLEAAARYMSEALTRRPESPELLRRTFLLRASIGDMDRALSLARRMPGSTAEHGAATVLRTLAAVRAGELDQARRVLGELPGRGLGELVAPLLGSWIALAEGNSPDNVADLSGLDGIQGIDLLQQVHAALIHDLSGRREAARKAFDAATADTDVLSLRLVWLAANFYARIGEPERALGLMDTYLKRNPGSTTAKLIRRRLDAAESPGRLVDNAEQGLAEALFNIAGLLNQQGATDLGLLYARLSLYMHPDFDFGQMLLGEVLQNQDRSAAAITAYRGVSEESPFRYVARLRMASALQRLNRPGEAIAALTAIADAQPARHEPYYRMGNVHRSEENFAAAATAYRKALDRLGETEARHWRLHYFLGIALERTDRWDAAEAQFKRALALKPEQPYVMNYLAYSWVEQEKNLDQAQKMLQQAVDQRPEDGFIVDSMGWVYYRLGHYEKAVRYLERAVELRPNDAVINDHLGDAYWKVGRRREARFQWHRALSLDPDAEVQARIERKLDTGLNAVDRPDG